MMMDRWIHGRVSSDPSSRPGDDRARCRPVLEPGSRALLRLLGQLIAEWAEAPSTAYCEACAEVSPSEITRVRARWSPTRWRYLEHTITISPSSPVSGQTQGNASKIRPIQRMKY
jgi:hypothetical protein